MKAKVTLTIEGVVELPEVWGDGYHALDIADYHYNDKLDEEDAIMDIVQLMKAECPDLSDVIVEASFEFADNTK